MNCRRFTAMAAAAGIAVPLLWFIVYWTFFRENPSLIYSIMSENHFDRVLLAVWPSWIFLVADPEERSFAIPVASVALNALLYGGIGWIVCPGLYRYRAALGLTVSAVIIGWYFLFRWYAGG